MKIKAVRKIKWDMGHRLVGHESKCANLHGHQYIAWFYAEAVDLDKIGRVVDFSVLKEKLGAWIDYNLDHTMMIFKDDYLLETLIKCETKKQFFLTEFNPTAENIARYLIKIVCPALLIGTGVKVTKIKLYETENCFVEVYSE